MKKILEKINNVRVNISSFQLTQELVLDFIEKMPIMFRNNHDWHNHLLFKEFVDPLCPYDGENYVTSKWSGFDPNPFDKADFAEIGSLHLKGDCRIDGRLTKLKFIKYLLWYHCYGSTDHRLSIFEDGRMAFIAKVYVHKGYFEFRRFDEYLEIRDIYDADYTKLYCTR